MSELTNQEKINYIDRVIEGLNSQGCLSYNKATDVCMYRSPNGSKCAIGLLIPDDKYNPIIESQYISTYPECQELMNLLEDIGIPVNDNAQFFFRLQAIHDKCGDFERTIQEYKEYRKEFEEII